MKNGDIVFFKRARTSTKRNSVEMGFKGHGFGLLLGHTPPFAKDPPKEHLLRMMGTVGFVSFDDIGEFFGTEIGAECVKKFEDKYWKAEQAAVKEPEVIPNQPLEPLSEEIIGDEKLRDL